MIYCFRCSVCGALYEDQKECQRCETGHSKIDFPANCTYMPGSRFPTTVRIAFLDGATRLYTLMPDNAQMTAINSLWQTQIVNGLIPDCRDAMIVGQMAPVLPKKS